jgi:hypothetical protein
MGRFRRRQPESGDGGGGKYGVNAALAVERELSGENVGVKVAAEKQRLEEDEADGPDLGTAAK